MTHKLAEILFRPKLTQREAIVREIEVKVSNKFRTFALVYLCTDWDYDNLTLIFVETDFQ